MGNVICHHCGATDAGFYVKETVTGTVAIWYTEKGDYATDQTDMYGTLNHSGGKNAYCAQCHKYIGKSENLKSGIMEEERFKY